jgi:hypothetical protein
MTMAITKTLILAAAAALSLGTGAAMAQDGSGGGPDYWSMPTIAAAIKAAKNVNRTAAPVQFGASDPDTTESGAAHSATFIFNHHLYGAGGVGG